ncbi:MAG: AAA family ATPase [delta proteobacterium ML8_F1]|nr:MAG: AAA family ATPase [delta proteobacterium ML8_F1]
MDLINRIGDKHLERLKPLADRMKPDTLEDILGQDHLLGEGKMLRRSIEADRLSSMIFHGPPGTGKTSLAQLVSKVTQSHFITINAVNSGIKDIKAMVSKARELLDFHQVRTVVFIDEIHRFNKIQQDALLPYVEQGIVILIGATTENPYFEVNPALLSRCLIFELKPLAEADIIRILKRSLQEDKVLKEQAIVVTEEAFGFLANRSSGDGRRALNALELGILSTQPQEGKIIINEAAAAECIQKKVLHYDKSGDNHYDVISAFIKSMRGSDPDATLHYLARMIGAGEDPKFIARRIIIAASEDVGLANPRALEVAVAAFTAVNFVGMPEGRIILAEAALYNALSPKSNSAYLGIDAALGDLENIQAGVPAHLEDATKKGFKKTSEPYRYPHDHPLGYVRQDYLPEGLRDKVYYRAKKLGEESRLNELIEKIKAYKE